MRRIAGVTALALLASCEVPLTQFVVGIDTDLAWGPGGEIESVVLEVRRGGAEGPLRDRRTTAVGTGAGRAPLAVWVSVSASDPSDATPLWLEALGCAQPSGCTRDTAVLAQRAVVRFTPQRSAMLRMLLARSCAASRCTLSERCDVSGGRCVAGDATGEVRALERVLPGRFGSGRAGGDAGVDSDVRAADDVITSPDANTATDVAPSVDAVAAMDVVAPRDVVTATDVVAPRDVVTAVDACATSCRGSCRDIQVDPRNCGSCGRACAAGQSCNQGMCVPSTGTQCPAGMVLVPGGTFVMGAPASEFATMPNERPQHTVTLNAYCLGRREVTLAEYLRCFAAGQCQEPLRGSPTCNAAAMGRESHPINCLDWTDAVAVCSFLYPSGRLPTEAEYEFAATAGGARQFPWGDTSPTNRICFSGSGGTRTSTCAVESYPDGASPLGIFDLAGNVAEWTSDWLGPYDSAAVSNPSGAASGAQRVVRGGGWNFSAPELARARLRGAREPGLGSDGMGVRCASGTR